MWRAKKRIPDEAGCPFITCAIMLEDIRKELREHADESHAKTLQRYFKTGPGEYGEGDRFLGVRVPAVRLVARKYRDFHLSGVLILLRSSIHEERLLALIILTKKYHNGDAGRREEIFRIYLDNTQHINNWDLVDTSAEHIIGAHLFNRSRKQLYELARSENLWDRRITIMSTFHFIRNDEFDETLKIAEILIADREDLIHKAVGWMLREIGKRDRNVEEEFLKRHYHRMPRTMLRYAIERFPEDLRKDYLRGAV